MPELTNPAPTSLNVASAVKILLCEFLALHFDGTTKALGEESAVAWPALPADRIVFDQGPNPPGGDLFCRVLLIEKHSAVGKNPGLAGSTGGNLHQDRFLALFHLHAAGTAGPAASAEQVSVAAGRLKGLLGNGDAQSQLANKRVHVVQGSVRDGGAVEVEEAGRVHLITAQFTTTYRARFLEP